MPRVVAVAGGVNKATSLLGAVRTGIPKVLITDQLAAESLSALVNGETNHYDASEAGGFQRS